jgi:hypothetical protein
MYAKCLEQCLAQNKSYKIFTIVILYKNGTANPPSRGNAFLFYFPSRRDWLLGFCVTACMTKDTHFPDIWLRLEVHSVVME